MRRRFPCRTATSRSRAREGSGDGSSMARVFISYWREGADQSVALAIRDRLTELEHQVFFDTTDLHTGDNWRRRLREELAIAEHFVPVLSSSYFESAVILEEELVPAVRGYERGELR